MRRATTIRFVLYATGLLFAASLWTHLQASPSLRADISPSENLAIIVNTSNTVDNLSVHELRTIFLGARRYWPNGRRITLVMMEPGQVERRWILQHVCLMAESEYRNHILHGLFTGELLVSPKTLSTPTTVRKFVFNVPGAIGYVRTGDLDASVKVIRVDGHLPEDKEYPLHIEQVVGR
jgi:hypothetical protein